MMHRVRFPSLEFSWLPLSDRKSMPTADVVYADVSSWSGAYVPAGYRLEEFEHTGSRNTIVLSTHYGETRRATVAHEFRHLMQRYLPSLPRMRLVPALDFGDTHETWAKAIRRFYRERPWEFDALRYETRFDADDPVTEDTWRALA
jgi:hypothetical protein